jgi:hypothetical protein
MQAKLKGKKCPECGGIVWWVAVRDNSDTVYPSGERYSDEYWYCDSCGRQEVGPSVYESDLSSSLFEALIEVEK